MENFTISKEDLKKLRELITEFEEYYEDSTEPWDFEDVDNQREIGSEIIMIINPVINEKDA